ncbi:MAG: hypothetical protein VF00_C0014G0005 [candidate division Kazan bacterium GW2011_GWB1_52_7]|uniref:DUF4349 domain-containing protein n=1 Tax=candidate division Kazan bacterium GW2011_GWB1_52_7 TaxID=1620414 RepID=A0A0G1ZEG0_UNCK3|nr:MAG: hypothetical protein VF00_C0014G0005 [candidate division Kazan bacterium GW2011_GWB1_52_7]
MLPLFSWVKKNKLASFVIAVLAILLILVWWKPELGGDIGGKSPDLIGGMDRGGAPTAGEEGSGGKVVIESSTASLVVSDVPARRGSDGRIDAALEAMAGIGVQAKLAATVSYYKTLAVKVAEESLVGVDVTEEFADLEARIKTLETTISQFEAIKARATKISDLVSITSQIISLREQIDVLKGQKKFIAEAAAYPKITVYLATDEFALPYQPPEGFRPGTVFKLAVRSLLSLIYAVGNFLIWAAVYSILWIPVLFLLRYLNRRFKIF